METAIMNWYPTTLDKNVGMPVAIVMALLSLACVCNYIRIACIWYDLLGHPAVSGGTSRALVILLLTCTSGSYYASTVLLLFAPRLAVIVRCVCLVGVAVLSAIFIHQYKTLVALKRSADQMDHMLENMTARELAVLSAKVIEKRLVMVLAAIDPSDMTITRDK